MCKARSLLFLSLRLGAVDALHVVMHRWYSQLGPLAQLAEQRTLNP